MKTTKEQKTPEKMSQLQRENYNQSYKPNIIAKKVMRELEEKVPKDKAILDCGCIDGRMLKKLEELGYAHLYGLDIFKHQELPKRFPFRLVDLNKDKIDFGRTFDAILATEVLEHLKNPYHFFEETHHALNPGGLFIVSTPHQANIFNRVYFLLTGESLRIESEESNRVIITKELVKRYAENKFEVYKIIPSHTTIPFFKWKFDWPLHVTANSLIYFMRKK